MKLRCPRCDSKIAVPDEWVGRVIRCRGCNKSFRVPKPVTTIAPTRSDAGLDLNDLASRERQSEELDADQTAAAEAQRSEQKTEARDRAAKGETGIVRTCPQCHKEVTVKDAYVEVLCSNCWEPIPALVRGNEPKTGGGGWRGMKEVGFYSGLAESFVYPIGALGSLIAAIVVAIGVILIPVTLFVGLARSVEQGTVGMANAPAPVYLRGVEIAVIVTFYAEVFFFAAVGVHAFLDCIRTTAVGDDKTPPLTWYPSQWGQSIMAYLALIGYFAVGFGLAIWLSLGRLALPTTATEFRAMLSPEIIGLACVMVFFVPMNLIGMSVSSIVRGLNPAGVVRSIAATHVNYLFLFLLLGTYVTVYVVAFSAVLTWFGGVVRGMSRAAGTGEIAEVAVGLVSWGVVISFGFYCTYVLGRLHGLFARSFRRNLQF